MASRLTALRTRALLAASRRSSLPARLGAAITVVAGERSVRVPLVAGGGPERAVLTEPHLIGVFTAALALRDGTFVDVGAFTGQTLVKKLLAGPDRPYLAFEPQPRAAAAVRALLDANGAPGEVIAAALGSRNGVVTLAARAELDEGASTIAGFRPPAHYARRATVPLLRGDDVLASLAVEGGEAPAAVAVLKVDAEGGELDVLAGFAGTVARDRPVIVCEVLPAGSPDPGVAALRGARVAGLSRWLAEHEYVPFAVGEDGRLAGDPVLGAAPPAPRDYVFVAAEDAGRLAGAVSGSLSGGPGSPAFLRVEWRR